MIGGVFAAGLFAPHVLDEVLHTAQQHQDEGDEDGVKDDAPRQIDGDHPFGVDTLPPMRLTAPRGQPADPEFDRSKYDEIGESDRMTLRFRKPNAAD